LFLHKGTVTDVTSRTSQKGYHVFRGPKVLSNFLNFTWNFLNIIFRCFTAYFKQKNTFIFLAIPNCELPKSGCFVIKKSPKSRFFGDYEKNIHRKLIWMILTRRSFWYHNKMVFIIVTLVRKNNRNCLGGTFQKTCWYTFFRIKIMYTRCLAWSGFLIIVHCCSNIHPKK